MKRNTHHQATRWMPRTVSILIVLMAGMTIAQSNIIPKKQNKGDQRIYLVHSDELKYDVNGPTPDAQIAKGHVQFRHQGAHVWCDSAYFYQESNSLKAFVHVRFKQGDTLSMNCDYAYYSGYTQMLQARRHVVLRHRNQVLNTDSLNYDRLYNSAYFFEGGTLTDGNDKLVADWGQYNMSTREAEFFYNVKMRSGDYLIETDTLFYDTRKQLAHILGKGSKITSKDSKVDTEDAYYNTGTKHAELFGRSMLVDKQRSIIGDSLYYEKDGNSYGYGNVIYVDQKNKHSLICDELHYNEATGYGYATKRALLKDFSQGDTLYAHADSIKIETFYINTDSVYRKVHCFDKVRAYRNDVQAVCDSLVFNSQDSCMTMYKDPIVWNEGRQLLGEKILVYMNDSTVRQANVVGQALSVEYMPQYDRYNQISAKEMQAYFDGGKLRRTEALGNVCTIYYPIDDKDSTLIGLNYLETDTMRMYLSAERKLEKIRTSKFIGTAYPINQIPLGRDKLENFAWFEDIRPLDKDDIFNWRGKKDDQKLRVIRRQEAPLQRLDE